MWRRWAAGSAAPAQELASITRGRAWSVIRGPISAPRRGHIAAIYFRAWVLAAARWLSGWRGKLAKDWTFLDNIHVGDRPAADSDVYPGFIGEHSVKSTVRASYTGSVSLYAAPDGKYLEPSGCIGACSGSGATRGVGSIRGPDQFSMNASDEAVVPG